MVLTCSSEASPPVKNSGYILYREGRFVGFGQNHTIPDVQPDDSGRYHCQAWNSISSAGIETFNSAAVLLQVYCTYVDTRFAAVADLEVLQMMMMMTRMMWNSSVLPDPPVNISIWMNPARAVWGSSVNLSCSSAANPPAENYTWYWRTDPSGSSGLQVASGQVLYISSMEASLSGLYLCQARNQLGEKNSTEMLLAMVEEEEEQGLCLVHFGRIIWVKSD